MSLATQRTAEIEAERVLRGHLLRVRRMKRERDIPETGHFWAQVDQSAGPVACWPWLGKKVPKGYGYISFQGNPIGAHRLAYLLDTGVRSGWTGSGRFCVRHLCHNPSCCNPKHLLLGVAADNKWDARMFERGVDLVAVRLRVENGFRFAGVAA